MVRSKGVASVLLCVFTGARVFRSLYAFRVQKDHSNDCAKYHVCRWSISNRGFRWSRPSLGSRQNVNLYPAVVITGARVFRSLYVFKVQKDHYNRDIQIFHKIVLSNSFCGIPNSTKWIMLSNFGQNSTEIFHKTNTLWNSTNDFVEFILLNLGVHTCAVERTTTNSLTHSKCNIYLYWYSCEMEGHKKNTE